MSNQITLPSNPQDRKKLQDMVSQMAFSMQKMDDERSHITDITKLAKEEYEVDPKVMRKLAKALHKHNFPDQQAEHEEFEYLYEALIEGRKIDDDD